MAEYTIYHNPRCSKSRQAKALLQEHGKEFEEILYLKTPPDEAEIRRILSILGVPVREIMRRKEKIYKELALDDPSKSEEELIRAIAAHPVLLERPIVLRGDQAVLARPTEKLTQLL